jgi:hypothetical protein
MAKFIALKSFYRGGRQYLKGETVEGFDKHTMGKLEQKGLIYYYERPVIIKPKKRKPRKKKDVSNS